MYVQVDQVMMSTVLETQLHAALATEQHTPPPTQIYYQQVRRGSKSAVLLVRIGDSPAPKSQTLTTDCQITEIFVTFLYAFVHD